MVWSEGNMSLKNPVTTPGIDPGTVRLVAQRSALTTMLLQAPIRKRGEDKNTGFGGGET